MHQEWDHPEVTAPRAGGGRTYYTCWAPRLMLCPQCVGVPGDMQRHGRYSSPTRCQIHIQLMHTNHTYCIITLMLCLFIVVHTLQNLEDSPFKEARLRHLLMAGDSGPCLITPLCSYWLPVVNDTRPHQQTGQALKGNPRRDAVRASSSQTVKIRGQVSMSGLMSRSETARFEGRGG